MSLELKNIYKSYGENILFEKFSLEFLECGFYLLTGKSGTGKSTLLNILAGYEGIDNGSRCINDHISLACIFQSYELIEELTVEENILMMQSIEELDMDILKQLNIEDLLDRYPSELSQGQKQRVGIARAFQCHPQVVICDEPTESLDNDNKESVLNLLKNYSKSHIVIVASHEIEILRSYYDYHYEIRDKNIVLVDAFLSQGRLQVDEHITQYNDKKVIQIIHKIIYKRTIFQTLFLSILILMQVSLFLLDSHLFVENDKYNALNKTSIYVKTYNENPDVLNKYSERKRPILQFSSVPIKNKVIK